VCVSRPERGGGGTVKVEFVGIWVVPTWVVKKTLGISTRRFLSMESGVTTVKHTTVSSVLSWSVAALKQRLWPTGGVVSPVCGPVHREGCGGVGGGWCGCNGQKTGGGGGGTNLACCVDSPTILSRLNPLALVCVREQEGGGEERVPSYADTKQIQQSHQYTKQWMGKKTPIHP